jgi:hypothetical protein
MVSSALIVGIVALLIAIVTLVVFLVLYFLTIRPNLNNTGNTGFAGIPLNTYQITAGQSLTSTTGAFSWSTFSFTLPTGVSNVVNVVSSFGNGQAVVEPGFSRPLPSNAGTPEFYFIFMQDTKVLNVYYATTNNPLINNGKSSFPLTVFWV